MATKYIRAVCLLLVLLQVCFGQSEIEPEDGKGKGPKGPPPTCPVPKSCPYLIVIHRPCGFSICFDYILVLQTCINTEPCKPQKNGGKTKSAPEAIEYLTEEEVKQCSWGSADGDDADTAPVDGEPTEAGIETEDGSGGGKTVPCTTQGGFTCMVQRKGCKGAQKSLDEAPQTVSEDGEGITDGVGDSTNEVAPIDGAWSTWNPWVSGNCPVTCCMGNPLQSRLRRCDSPAPAGTGADCPGLHYALRTAPDSERCGSMDNQCPIICESATSRYADTCRRCVNNYYQCDAEGAAPRRVNCPEGQVWSQHMTGCVTPSFCNAVERF